MVDSKDEERKIESPGISLRHNDVSERTGILNKDVFDTIGETQRHIITSIRMLDSRLKILELFMMKLESILPKPLPPKE